MSVGPVSIRNEIGMMNLALLKEMIRKDRTLLKLLKPITLVNLFFTNSLAGRLSSLDSYLLENTLLGYS